MFGPRHSPRANPLQAQRRVKKPPTPPPPSMRWSGLESTPNPCADGLRSLRIGFTLERHVIREEAEGKAPPDSAALLTSSLKPGGAGPVLTSSASGVGSIRWTPARAPRPSGAASSDDSARPNARTGGRHGGATQSTAFSDSLGSTSSIAPYADPEPARGDADAARGRPLDAAAAQLRDAIATNLPRVIDLLREWDEDDDGKCSRAEFRKALYFAFWGVRVPPETSNALFAAIDLDRSGTVDYRELHALLRRRVPLPATLLPGGAGHIATASTNSIGLRSSPSSASLAPSASLREDALVYTAEHGLLPASDPRAIVRAEWCDAVGAVGPPQADQSLYMPSPLQRTLRRPPCPLAAPHVEVPAAPPHPVAEALNNGSWHYAPTAGRSLAVPPVVDAHADRTMDRTSVAPPLRVSLRVAPPTPHRLPPTPSTTHEPTEAATVLPLPVPPTVLPLASLRTSPRRSKRGSFAHSAHRTLGLGTHSLTPPSPYSARPSGGIPAGEQHDGVETPRVPLGYLTHGLRARPAAEPVDGRGRTDAEDRQKLQRDQAHFLPHDTAAFG